MLSIRMSFDGRSVYLSPEQDVDALKSDIVAAVKAGGGSVTFRTLGEPDEVALIVTPAIPIFFESKTTPDFDQDSADGAEAQFGTLGWDEY